MIIAFNIDTKMVTGVNPKEISMLDDIFILDDKFINNIKKTIKIKNKIKRQGTNNNGELLYIEEIRNMAGVVIDKKLTTSKYSYKYERDGYINPTYFDENSSMLEFGVMDYNSCKQIENKPYMINDVQYKEINILDNPTEFSLDDINYCKYKQILEDSKCLNIIAFTNDIKDINIFESQFECGDKGQYVLRPGDKIVLKKFNNLDKPTNKFEILDLANKKLDIYVNDYKINNNVLILKDDIDIVEIKIENNTELLTSLNSLAIGHY